MRGGVFKGVLLSGSVAMFFWKKERQIEREIEEYLQETEQCLSTFGQACEVYFQEGLSGPFEQLVRRTHDFERRADEKRREIETTMYDKALIPESRGDILGMLEALDLVPNKGESVLYQIWTQRMIVPDQFAGQIKELIQTNIASYGMLCRTMRHLFGDAKRVAEGTGLVREKERRSDAVEQNLIRAIFESDQDKADKILLKELVLEIGSISDLAENAADRLRIVAVKRQS